MQRVHGTRLSNPECAVNSLVEVLSLFDFGSRPLYTRTSQVWSPRRTISPTLRAIKIPSVASPPLMAHSARLFS